jgi:hypothetical protein
MSSAWEHFLAAAAILASVGPMKHRLAEAYRTQLANIDTDELPKEIREEFSTLSSSMCSVPPLRGETAIQATVRKMSDQEACSLARRIIDMLGVIARQQAVQRPKLRVVGEE